MSLNAEHILIGMTVVAAIFTLWWVWNTFLRPREEQRDLPPDADRPIRRGTGGKRRQDRPR